VAIFRVLLPLLFLTEGVSHHSFLMELNGAERLAVAFVLSSFKTQVSQGAPPNDRTTTTHMCIAMQ
jgi:hypothetical protein